MKVFRNKITKRLGETQFGEDAEVLIRNAKSSGLKNEEIEIIDMSPQEYKEEIRMQDIGDMSKEQKDEIKIKEEMNKILRDIAIKSLKDRGEL